MVIGSSMVRKLIILLKENEKEFIQIDPVSLSEGMEAMVFRFLKYIGFEVAIASNSVEALAVFQEKLIDLVLTDYQMPVMDGFSLANHIKERSPGTPVIMMTGSDGSLSGRKWIKELLNPSYSSRLSWKTFKGLSRERWHPENYNMETYGRVKFLALLLMFENRRGRKGRKIWQTS